MLTSKADAGLHLTQAIWARRTSHAWLKKLKLVGRLLKSVQWFSLRSWCKIWDWCSSNKKGFLSVKRKRWGQEIASCQLIWDVSPYFPVFVYSLNIDFSEREIVGTPDFDTERVKLKLFFCTPYWLCIHAGRHRARLLCCCPEVIITSQQRQSSLRCLKFPALAKPNCAGVFCSIFATRLLSFVPITDLAKELFTCSRKR